MPNKKPVVESGHSKLLKAAALAAVVLEECSISTMKNLAASESTDDRYGAILAWSVHDVAQALRRHKYDEALASAALLADLGAHLKYGVQLSKHWKLSAGGRKNKGKPWTAVRVQQDAAARQLRDQRIVEVARRINEEANVTAKNLCGKTFLELQLRWKNAPSRPTIQKALREAGLLPQRSNSSRLHLDQ